MSSFPTLAVSHLTYLEYKFTAFSSQKSHMSCSRELIDDEMFPSLVKVQSKSLSLADWLCRRRPVEFQCNSVLREIVDKLRYCDSKSSGLTSYIARHQS